MLESFPCDVVSCVRKIESVKAFLGTLKDLKAEK